MAIKLEQFEDLGISVLKATEWLDRLGVEHTELMEPGRFEKIKDVMQFLSRFENSDYLLTKLNRGFTKDLVQKTWEYIKQYEQKEKLLSAQENIGKEVELIKDIPDAQEKVRMLKNELIDTKIAIGKIDKELMIYETN